MPLAQENATLAGSLPERIACARGQPEEGMMATNNPTEPRTYPAEKARQGEIILRSRASRIIFIAALAGAIILAAALSWFYVPYIDREGSVAAATVHPSSSANSPGSA
jgi:hypothetical protein